MTYSDDKSDDLKSSLIEPTRDQDIEANTNAPTEDANEKGIDLNCDVDLSECCDSGTKRWTWCACVCVVLIVAMVLLIVSLKRLESTEYGLEYHPRKKELDEVAKQGGLHAGPPGYSFVKFPSTYITVNLDDGKCVSRDGLRVSFDVTFQYQMPIDWVLPATLKYRNYGKWSQVVRAAGNSAVQHSCSAFNVSNFQNKRGVIQSTMEDNLRLKLEGTEENNFEDGVYARAISLQLSNVDLPEEYSQAVADKQSANEDISLAKNQRQQNITKAQTDLNTAKEEARKIYDSAQYDANITLTEANLQAEEISYRFETEKQVLLGVRDTLGLSTNGLLAYLTNQLYAEAPELSVAAEEPVQLSRKVELVEEL